MMNLIRAIEINRKIYKVIVALHVEERFEPLPGDLTLEDMLVATRMVTTHNISGESNPDGTKTTYMVADPRIIALLYAFEHFGKDPVALLGALNFNFDKDAIEFCAGCWTFTRSDYLSPLNGHLYCQECQEAIKEEHAKEKYAQTAAINH